MCACSLCKTVSYDRPFGRIDLTYLSITNTWFWPIEGKEWKNVNSKNDAPYQAIQGKRIPFGTGLFVCSPNLHLQVPHWIFQCLGHWLQMKFSNEEKNAIRYWVKGEQVGKGKFFWSGSKECFRKICLTFFRKIFSKCFFSMNQQFHWRSIFLKKKHSQLETSIFLISHFTLKTKVLLIYRFFFLLFQHTKSWAVLGLVSWPIFYFLCP